MFMQKYSLFPSCPLHSEKNKILLNFVIIQLKVSYNDFYLQISEHTKIYQVIPIYYKQNNLISGKNTIN